MEVDARLDLFGLLDEGDALLGDFCVAISTISPTLRLSGRSNVRLARPSAMFGPTKSYLRNPRLFYRPDQVTWECFCVLSGRFDAHNLVLMHLSRIFSGASIGKAYADRGRPAGLRPIRRPSRPDVARSARARFWD